MIHKKRVEKFRLAFFIKKSPEYHRTAKNVLTNGLAFGKINRLCSDNGYISPSNRKIMITSFSVKYKRQGCERSNKAVRVEKGKRFALCDEKLKERREY